MSYPNYFQKNMTIQKMLFRSVVAVEGDRVEMSCFASGYPPPEIYWRRMNNDILPTNTSIHKGHVLVFPGDYRNVLDQMCSLLLTLDFFLIGFFYVCSFKFQYLSLSLLLFQAPINPIWIWIPFSNYYRSHGHVFHSALV